MAAEASEGLPPLGIRAVVGIDGSASVLVGALGVTLLLGGGVRVLAGIAVLGGAVARLVVLHGLFTRSAWGWTSFLALKGVGVLGVGWLLMVLRPASGFDAMLANAALFDAVVAVVMAAYVFHRRDVFR